MVGSCCVLMLLIVNYGLLLLLSLVVICISFRFGVVWLGLVGVG